MIILADEILILHFSRRHIFILLGIAHLQSLRHRIGKKSFKCNSFKNRVSIYFWDFIIFLSFNFISPIMAIWILHFCGYEIKIRGNCIHLLQFLIETEENINIPAVSRISFVINPDAFCLYFVFLYQLNNFYFILNLHNKWYIHFYSQRCVFEDYLCNIFSRLLFNSYQKAEIMQFYPFVCHKNLKI